MDLDAEEFVTPQVGIVAAAVAVVASPQVRNVVRKGAVFGLAGVLMAGDAVTSFARGVGQGAQRVAQGASQAGGAVAQRVPIMHDGREGREGAAAGESPAEEGHAQ